MAIDDARILVSFYVGAYGPTLRIDMQTREHVALMTGIFTRLMEEPNSSTVLAADGPWTFTGVGAITLVSVPGSAPIGRAVAGQGPHGTRVDWQASSDGWLQCLGLLEGLTDTDEPGHQYLTEEIKGQVLVVLAFREHRQGEPHG